MERRLKRYSSPYIQIYSLTHSHTVQWHVQWPLTHHGYMQALSLRTVYNSISSCRHRERAGNTRGRRAPVRATNIIPKKFIVYHTVTKTQTQRWPCIREKRRIRAMSLVKDASNPKAVLFLFEFTSPRTYDPGFRFFVKQMFKTGGKKKKNVPSLFFL